MSLLKGVHMCFIILNQMFQVYISKYFNKRLHRIHIII